VQVEHCSTKKSLPEMVSKSPDSTPGFPHFSQQFIKVFSMPANPNPIPDPLPPSEVRRIRAKFNLSQRDIAAHLGYATGQMVSHWESGRKPCLGAAAQILRLYDRSNGRAMEWAFIPFEAVRNDIRKASEG
jgi:DNA-binding transcriptional regulator YiaG